MPTQKLIAVADFCKHHHVKADLIVDLHRNEIIELVVIERKKYITEKNLASLERALRLHSDLQINIEGIQTILHLLSNLEKKEAELTALRNQLNFYLL